MYIHTYVYTHVYTYKHIHTYTYIPASNMGQVRGEHNIKGVTVLRDARHVDHKEGLQMWR